MNRITNKWTKTTAEAFGDTASARKGVLAEELYHDYALRVYDEVQYFPEDYKMQIKGIDFLIKKDRWYRAYGVDVKGNMSEKGTFCVENTPDGWLRNIKKQNDRVCHICVETRWAIEYDRNDMIIYLDKAHPSEWDIIYLNPRIVDIKSFTRNFKV